MNIKEVVSRVPADLFSRYLLAFMSCLAMFSASVSFAGTINVPGDQATIKAAIDAAVNGDVIQLEADTYYEGEVLSTQGKAITIRGVEGSDGTPLSIIDGANTHRVLQCTNNETDTTVFENLVIQNGYNSNTEGGRRDV